MINGRKVAEVDYNSEAEDILFVLQEEFGNEVPELYSENLKELAENYKQEQTEDILKAFGQEMTIDHIMLYAIDEDSDAYVLTLVPEGEATAFEQDMKNIKRKVRQLKQPRKKAGSAAKRIDFSKRLSCKICKLPEGMRLHYGICVEGLCGADNIDSQNEEDMCTCLLSLEPEPHIVHTTSKRLDDLSGENGRYAAIYLNSQKNEQGILIDKASYIAVGDSLDNIDEWRIIYKDEEGFLETCFWFGDDLFLAGRNKAAVIKNAMLGGCKIEFILKRKESELTFSKFFVVNGKLYLYMQGMFYRWNKKKFLSKEGFNTVVYKIKTKTVGQIVYIGNNEIAFVERNFSRPRSAEIFMMDITLLNMETGNIRKISCPDGGVKSIEEGRLIVLCSRHDVVKNKKDLPILINIDIESGERKALAYGKMGSEEIIDVFKTPSGRIVFRTYEGDRIYYPEKLDEFMF